MSEPMTLQDLKDRVARANNAVWETGKVAPATITKEEYNLLTDAAQNYADRALMLIDHEADQ